jgi:hypothetical protein
LTASQPAKLGAAVAVAGMLFGLHGGGVAGKAPPLVLAVPSVGVRRQVDDEPAGDPGGEAIMASTPRVVPADQLRVLRSSRQPS